MTVIDLNVVFHDQAYLHPQDRKMVERDFYDRDEQKERAETALRSWSRLPVIIMGERRAGKTSLLHLLIDHLANDRSGRFVPVKIPWHGISSRDELMKVILREACEKLDQALPDIDLGASERRSLASFGKFLNHLRRLSTPDKTLVLCIDEFDSLLLHGALKREEREKILGMVQELVESSEAPVKMLFTMSRIPDTQDTRTSPVIAKAEQVHLNPFKKQDFDEMVHGLLRRQEQLLSADIQRIDLDRLYDLSGGWPFFAKLLLMHLVKIIPNDEWLDQALEKAIAEPGGIQQTLDDIYAKHFNDNEKAMILLLASNAGRISAEEMSVLGDSLREGAANLAKRHFISRDDGGNYTFRIGYLATWFPRWRRFESEVNHRLSRALLRLARIKDPWAGGEWITVSKEDEQQ